MHKFLIRGFALSMAILLAFVNPAGADTPPQILTVYTYGTFSSSYGAGPLLKERFEKTHGVQVKFVSLETSLLLAGRLKREGLRTRADVVVGLDLLTMPDLEPYFSSPFVAYDSTCLAFVYDKTRIKNPPETFREFVDQEDSLLLQDPRTSTVGLSFLGWIQHIFPENQQEVWKRLAPRIVTYTKKWSESYALFLKGEAPYVLSYMTSPLYHAIEEGDDRYGALNFTEGNACVHEYAGIPKASSHKELAQAFLDLLLSPEGQELVATKGWVYPVGEIPAVWQNSPTFQRPQHPIDLEDMDFDRDDLINAWLELSHE